MIKQFTQFDDVVGQTVAEEVSQQLDAMQGIGVNTITFELRSTDSVFIRGPRAYPECNVSPHLGLVWPNPEEEHLANLVSFLDLVESKDMRVLLRLVNTRMDDRYRAASEMWLGSILGSIRGHPALELVLFEGDQRYHDTDGDGVQDACGEQAEPPLWLGPDGVGARYVEWAMGYALSLGFAPEKLSAEAVIGVYVIDQGPDHLWFTPGVMRTIFERVGIPDGQRTYAISFYQGRRCRFADGLPCEDADPHDWTDESLLRTLHAIGLESTAGIIAPEFGAAAPIEGGWGSVEALESAVELMRKRGVRGGSLWRWTSFDDEEDADATLWEPVKRRGPGYVYTRVRDVMRRLYTPFTDDPIQPGVTPVKAIHFMELRARIDALREVAGLQAFSWTDPVLRTGATRIRLAHLLELRRALADAYAAAGRAAPGWTDASPAPASTPVRAAHLMELRAAVVALE